MGQQSLPSQCLTIQVKRHRLDAQQKCSDIHEQQPSITCEALQLKKHKQLGSLCKVYLFCALSPSTDLGQFEIFFNQETRLTEEHSASFTDIQWLTSITFFTVHTLVRAWCNTVLRHDDRLMIPTCLTTAENSCKAIK